MEKLKYVCTYKKNNFIYDDEIPSCYIYSDNLRKQSIPRYKYNSTRIIIK